MEDPDDVALGSGYPAAAGQAVDARGMLQAATDLVNPVTAARESRGFPVGERLACTPGAVVYREEIFELL